MYKKMFLLLLLPIGLVQAQHAVIAGKFPYQGSVPYAVHFSSNQILFREEWGRVSDTSNSEGFFHLTLPLDKPTLLKFVRAESIDLYLRPGDSIWIEMINNRNLRIEGTAAHENRMLQRSYPSVVSAEMHQNLDLYSRYIDSLFNENILELIRYQSKTTEKDFSIFFEAMTNAGYLHHKMEIFKSLCQADMEGALMDKVRRQLQIEPIDEVRSMEYVHALKALFELEVLEIMGQDLSRSSIFGVSNVFKQNYPPGFEELFDQHFREKLAKYPKLYNYFDLAEKATQILKCNKAEQLPVAEKILEQIKKAEDYPGLVKRMSELYRKKVIQYQLSKLPEMEWRDTQGAVLKLKAEDKINERTLVVFWDAHTQEGVTAYQSFQQLRGLRLHLPNQSLDLANNINRQQILWVQVGGEKEAWKKVINTIPDKYAVKHCIMENPRNIADLTPYLYTGKLPVAFALGEDLSIQNISNRPSISETPDFFDNFDNFIIWRIPRE